MHSFKDSFRWCNNNDVLSTLEVKQKMVEVCHNKGIDMLKLGCTLPILANICLHSSTSAKFYPFKKNDKDMLSKVREDMVGGPSKVFTHQAVVDETHNRSFTKVCKLIVGRDASQLYIYSICQPMPTRLHKKYEFDADLQRFKPRLNNSRSFGNIVMSVVLPTKETRLQN